MDPKKPLPNHGSAFEEEQLPVQQQSSDRSPAVVAQGPPESAVSHRNTTLSSNGAIGSSQKLNQISKNRKKASEELKKERLFTQAKGEVKKIKRKINISKEEQEQTKLRSPEMQPPQRPSPSNVSLEMQQVQQPSPSNVSLNQRQTVSAVQPSYLTPPAMKFTLSAPPPELIRDEPQDQAATQRTINSLQHELVQYESLVQTLSPQLMAARGTPQEPHLRARFTDATIEVNRRRARILELTGKADEARRISQIPTNITDQPPPITMDERMTRIEALGARIRQCKYTIQQALQQLTTARGTPQEAGLVATYRDATNEMRTKQACLDKMVADVEEIRKLPTQTQLDLYRSQLQQQLGRYGIETSSIQPGPAPSFGSPSRIRLPQGPAGGSQN